MYVHSRSINTKKCRFPTIRRIKFYRKLGWKVKRGKGKQDRDNARLCKRKTIKSVELVFQSITTNWWPAKYVCVCVWKITLPGWKTGIWKKRFSKKMNACFSKYNNLSSLVITFTFCCCIRQNSRHVYMFVCMLQCFQNFQWKWNWKISFQKRLQFGKLKNFI